MPGGWECERPRRGGSPAQPEPLSAGLSGCPASLSSPSSNSATASGSRRSRSSIPFFTKVLSAATPLLPRLRQPVAPSLEGLGDLVQPLPDHFLAVLGGLQAHGSGSFPLRPPRTACLVARPPGSEEAGDQRWERGISDIAAAAARGRGSEIRGQPRPRERSPRPATELGTARLP